MDDDLRRLLVSIVDRIDAQVPRLDSIDEQLKRLDAIDWKLKRLDATVSAQGEQLRTLSDAVALVAGLQADTSKALGELNERLGRMVEGSVRGRTSDAERHAALEVRVAELELQVRALAAVQGR